jgi:acyl-CoA dehydrogenase
MALDFAFSQDQEMIRQSVRDIFSRFDRDALREKVLVKKEFPYEVWDAVSEAGFMGAMIPEEYGGTGMGLLPVALMVEEMAKLGFGNAIMVLTTMDAMCIVKSGEEAVKRKFLPKIATGERKLCFAVTEADAGSNTFRIQTRAERRGDTYVINGSKTWITGADVADHVLLVTRTKPLEECVAEGLPKAYGLSLFLVPTDAKGLTKDLLPTGAIEGMNQFTLFFDDVEVPAENRVGEEHAGAMALFKALNPERILAAAMVVGVSEYCLKVACEYARERKVFKNTPIGQYQGIQHPLADVKIRQEAVRLATYKAAWAVDSDLPPMETGHAANVAKYLAAELGIAAVDAAIETLGGNGFSEDYGLIHLWEGMRLLKTAPVSKEMILNYVAEHVLELPRSY